MFHILTTAKHGCALLFVLLALSPLLAGDDLWIYADQCHNGWDDWGWVPHYASNSPVHAGSGAMVFAATNAWQAWWLKHGDIDTSLYTHLTLWVNGGGVGGQYLGVNAELGGSSSGLPRLGATAPTNAWKQITLSLSDLGVADKSNLTGLQIWNGGTLQSNFFIDDIMLVAKPPPALVHVSVNATQTVRTVDERIFGVNTAAWDGYLDTPSTLAVLTEMDNRVLRWPGGSWGNDYHWTNEYRGWGSYTTNFVRVVTNTAAQVFMIANYGTGTPEEAAGWVRQLNITNRLGFKYWEVGNENFGSWESDIQTNAPYQPRDPWTYAMRFKDYYAQMKAADPTIRVGAVATESETSFANYTNHPAYNPRTGQTHHGWTPVMLATLRTNGVTPDFLVLHKYVGNNGDALNLLWNKTWTADALNTRQMIADYLGPAGTNIEMVCTENGAGGNRQRTSVVGGLFWADSIGQVLQTEINALLWWDLRNGRSSITPDPTLYGWRDYYDEGVVCNNAEPTNRYPTFHCGKLMKHFARGGDRVVTATTDYPLLSAYAVRRTNGALTLLVINKSANSSLNCSMAIGGYRPASNASIYRYGIPQDEAARTNGPAAAQDIVVTSFNAAGTNLTHVFPPYSASVLSLQPAPPALRIQDGAPSGLELAFDTVWGPAYALEFRTNLNQANWQTLTNIAGTGAPVTVTHPLPASASGFYRVRIQ